MPFVVVIALLGGCWDIKTARIPNWLTLPGILLGLILGLYRGEIVTALLGIAVAVVIILPFAIKGCMGAGDLKFLAALGAIGGPIFAFQSILFGSVFGAMSALLVIIHKKTGKLEKFNRWTTTSDGMMPYGIYISLGALLSLYLGGM